MASHGNHLPGQGLSLLLMDLGELLNAQIDHIKAQDKGDERRRNQRHQQHAVPNAPALEHGSSPQNLRVRAATKGDRSGAAPAGIQPD